MVGSSPQTSSPTSARAIASRISGVGSVSVSERRSTMSCTPSPLRAQSLRCALAPLRIAVLVCELPEQRDRVGGATLAEVDVGEERKRLRDHGRARVVLDDLLEARLGPERIALADVPGRDPDFLLREAAATDLDLGQRVRRVATLGVILHQLLELLHRLGGKALVLLDGLDLVVVGHGVPVLHQVGDLMARVERHERLELLGRLGELRVAIERLADEEARARRVRRVRMSLGHLAEMLTGFRVALLLQLRFTELVELIGRQDWRGGGAHPGAAAAQEENHEDQGSQHRAQHIAHFAAQKSFDFARLARYYHSGFAARAALRPGGRAMTVAPRESLRSCHGLSEDDSPSPDVPAPTRGRYPEGRDRDP